MPRYSSFSFKAVKKQFGLKSVKGILFDNLEPLQPSSWLLDSLERTSKMAIVSEKSRSEWIVSPIMVEVKYRNSDKMNVLSGENMDAAKDQSLTGECDFIFVKDPFALTVESLIFCLVEAERNDLMILVNQSNISCVQNSFICMFEKARFNGFIFQAC